MQTLARNWHAVDGQPGWQTWQRACVPHVLNNLQTAEYDGLFMHDHGRHRLTMQRFMAEEICRLAWLSSAAVRRRRQDNAAPDYFQRERALAQSFLGVGAAPSRGSHA